MKHRRLRIMWSMAWGTAAVLIIALWVRSYSRLQIVEKRTSLEAIQISSVKGRIACAVTKPNAKTGKAYLSVVAGDAAEWRKKGSLGLAYYHDSFVTALIMPHWLPAAALAFIATMPWIPRPLRFGLRTLLIAMMLVAVQLGLAVYLAAKR